MEFDGMLAYKLWRSYVVLMAGWITEGVCIKDLTRFLAREKLGMYYSLNMNELQIAC